MQPSPSHFFKSKLFFLWLGLVGICFVVTLFIRLQVGEKIRSFRQDGEIELTSTPAGAQVLIDGKESGLTPLHEKLHAGTYQVIFKRGAWEIPQEVTVKVRETSPVSVRFNYATVSFSSEPDAIDVVLDGTRIGTTPCSATEISPGSHTLVYGQGNQSITEPIEIREGDVLQRKASFDLYQSTISDGNKVVLVVPEPPDWIGTWTGRTDRLANGKQSKPAVSKLEINSDLHTGFLIEHLGFLPIEVPVAVSATGTRLEAQGSFQSGDITYVATAVLIRIPNQPQATVDILRHYFYRAAETNSNRSSGIMDKVRGL
jgi:hypothetical protein